MLHRQWIECYETISETKIYNVLAKISIMEDALLRGSSVKENEAKKEVLWFGKICHDVALAYGRFCSHFIWVQCKVNI